MFPPLGPLWKFIYLVTTVTTATIVANSNNARLRVYLCAICPLKIWAKRILQPSRGNQPWLSPGELFPFPSPKSLKNICLVVLKLETRQIQLGYMNFRSEAERGVCARNLFKVEAIFLLRLRPVTRFSKVPGTYRQSCDVWPPWSRT